MTPSYVVITGASSGIGAACVSEFASKGFRTIGIDIKPTSDAGIHVVIDLLDSGLSRSDQSENELGSRHALGRVASLDEIAKVLRLVAVDGTFMTGSSIVIDGGALARLSTD